MGTKERDIIIFISIVCAAIAIIASSELSRLKSETTKETKRESLGKIITAEVIPTSVFESNKMQIKTEKAIVIIGKLISVPLGITAYKECDSLGFYYFTWEGSKEKYPFFVDTSI